MKKILLALIVLASIFVSIPWSKIGLPEIDKKLWEYKLGLDLHGGIELDYLVDFSNTVDITPERKTQILEDMKTILDWRVRRIGTTEPTLNTAQYGEETHIIVQIPTPSEHDSLPADERQKKDEEFIAEAKAVIGQVIKIQFKEPRTEAEIKELKDKRGSIVTAINTAFTKNTDPFESFVGKMGDTYENVLPVSSVELETLTGSPLTVKSLEKLFKIDQIKLGKPDFSGPVSKVTLGQISGNGIIIISSLDGQPLTEESAITAKMLFINDEPLPFKPALGKNGEPLDEKHLINTIPSPDQTTGQYVVNLVFDTEGQKMFGDITERNSGGVIAIYLGNTLLTAPQVSQRIDGNAIITPGQEADTKGWATTLSKKINEGIVPVGIYEHSEHTIGPNLGKTSLNKLIISAVVGIFAVLIFLLWRYGTAGIVAMVSLVIHIIILLALVRILGITLTLSGVAGIVLSIGIAIDSNILLLERVHDFLEEGKDMTQSLKLGFREAWSAVWDSNITGLLVGLILWWMGVSLVKWFGQMTVLGIIISLWVIKYICNPLTVWLRKRLGA